MPEREKYSSWSDGNLFAVGDIHGQIDKYLSLLNSLPCGSRSIVLGDLYIGRPNVEVPALPGHTFLRGNHDSPGLCREHPGYLGDYGYIHEHDLFFLSGARSANWRVVQNSRYYFRDEELSAAELEEAITLYARVKPRILLSHEAPRVAVEEVLSGLVGNYFAAKADGLNSRTCVALQQMLDVHPPEIWAFGNYHISREFKIGGTRFRGLAELEVYELHRSDLDDLH